MFMLVHFVNFWKKVELNTVILPLSDLQIRKNVHVATTNSGIQKCFYKSISSRFPWIGADTADVIFLNDYPWMQSQITWDDF